MLERRPKSKRGGFTLVELLVVIAILGILTALVFGGTMRSRTRARQMQCMGNVRQLGLGLGIFLNDHGEYPLSINQGYHQGINRHHRVAWAQSILQQDSIDPTGVLQCPAAIKPPDWPDNLGYAHYGYNGYGTGMYSPGIGLGLGGHTKPVPQNSPSTDLAMTPVKENEVVAPAATYAIGDGFQATGQIIKDGTTLLWRSASTQDYLGSSLRSQKRHDRKANIGFCDGHVETISLARLFEEDSDEALGRWNRDNKPHREPPAR